MVLAGPRTHRAPAGPAAHGGLRGADVQSVPGLVLDSGGEGGCFKKPDSNLLTSASIRL